LAFSVGDGGDGPAPGHRGRLPPMGQDISNEDMRFVLYGLLRVSHAAEHLEKLNSYPHSVCMMHLAKLSVALEEADRRVQELAVKLKRKHNIVT
jgi:hypothetical protein